MDHELMGRNEYAAHRGLRSPNAVTKAEKDGRIAAAVVRDPDGKFVGIKWRLADELWKLNTDPVEAARSGTYPVPGAPGEAGLVLTGGAGAPSDKPPAPTPPAKTGDEGNFLAARVKEAELRGELLELDKLERIGELLPRAVVRREFSEIFAQLKNAAFRIPDRKAQVLAGETDPVRIHRVLSDELRQVFDEFSRQLDLPAAGMADDSGVAGERAEALS